MRMFLTAFLASVTLSSAPAGESPSQSPGHPSAYHEAAAAIPHPATPRIGPEENDVTMRTLEFRDVPPGSQMDALSAVRDFHATRLEWTYIDFDERNRRLIEKVREMGIMFGGAGSASLHGSILKYPQQPDEIHMLNLNGEPVVQPHMRQWTTFRGIGDPSNSDYYDYHLEYYKKIVDWGAQTLHRDEPESPVFAAQRYGGGFSPSGLAGFREWLILNLTEGERKSLGIEEALTFDYGEYLRQRNAPVGDDFAHFDDPLKPHWIQYWETTTTDFWKRFLADIKAYGGEHLTFSANNSSLQMWEPYHQVFDFAISELLLETANPVHIWKRSGKAREQGKVQALGPPKTRSQPVSHEEKIILLRRVVATAYACGMIGKVPWDVFDQSPDGESRYFAKPSEIADLFAFVRGNDWKNYEEVGAFGKGISSGAPLSNSILVAGGSGGIFGFIRAPRDAARPVLIHLIDWGLPSKPPGPGNYFTSPSGVRIRMYTTSENIQRTPPEPSTLRINVDTFANPDRLSFHLLTPVDYDPADHKHAFESQDYRPLTGRQSIGARREGDQLILELPPLSPWGIVEITEHAN